MKTAAQIVRIQLERVADVLVGEHPRIVRGEQPLFRLGEELTATWLARERKLLIAIDRVLENGEHQPLFAARSRAPAPEVRKKLRRQQGIGLEQTHHRLTHFNSPPRSRPTSPVLGACRLALANRVRRANNSRAGSAKANEKLFLLL